MSEINRRLTQLSEGKIFLINHDKTIATRHFNESKLHLNSQGSQNYQIILQKLFDCHEINLW